MKKLLGVLLLLAIGAAAAAALLYARVNQPYRGYDGAEQFVRSHREAAPRDRSGWWRPG
jgi:hypothetical protein